MGFSILYDVKKNVVVNLNKNETYLVPVEELLEPRHLLMVPSMLKMKSRRFMCLNKINIGLLDFFDDVEVGNFLFPAI